MSEKKEYYFLKFLIRGIVGFCAIFLLNLTFGSLNMPILVGLNLCNFLVAGSLGIPGVALLYGILFYQAL